MKKIQKGFTLVELIVVMSLMGIIMAIIMSIITPTSRAATKIEYRANAEDTGIKVSRAVKNTLSFATNVAVIAANDGEDVPVPPSEYGTYTNVYICDNTTARAQSAKGACGEIRVGQWNNTTHAITNEVNVIQAPNYFENDFDISIKEYNSERGDATTVGSSYIILSLTGHPMIVDSTGNYAPDLNQNFVFNDCIEFTNINNWATIKNGGNSSAANYKIYIDEASLRTKTDKIYIFFTPAADTPIVTGTGILVPDDGTTNPDEPSTGGGTGGSGTGGSGTGGSGTTEKVTVVFQHTTGGAQHVQVTKGSIPSAPNDNNSGSQYVVDGEDYIWEFKGWRTGTTFLTESGPTVNATTTFYPVYEKVDAVKVKFVSYDGTTVLKEQMIQKNTAATAPETVPEAPAGYAFDKWQAVDGGKALGQNLIAATTYKAVAKEATNLTTFKVKFMNPFNGRVGIEGTNKVTINNNPYPDATQIRAWFESAAAGDEYKIVVEDGGSLGARFALDLGGGQQSPVQPFLISSSMLDHGTHEYYVWVDNGGNFKVTPANQYNVTPTKIQFVFVDENVVENVKLSGPSGNVGFAVPDSTGSQVKISKGGYLELFSGHCQGTRVATIFTDCSATVGSNAQGTINLPCNGVNQIVYVYRENGDIKISGQKPERQTRVVMHFVEQNDPGVRVAFTENGKYEIDQNHGLSNSNPTTASANWGASHFGMNCPAGSTHWFETTAAGTIAPFNNQTETFEFNTSKAIVEVWFVGGKFVSEKPAGWVNPTTYSGNVTVHFSKSKKKSYANGEEDLFVRLNGSPNWGNSEDASITLSAGQALKVELVSGWSNVKAVSEFTYDQLAGASINEMWVMNGKIYISKPSDWAA